MYHFHCTIALDFEQLQAPHATHLNFLLQGRNFGAWMRESGLRAQEQIRVKKDGGRVLIQRVPSDMKVSWVRLTVHGI